MLCYINRMKFDYFLSIKSDIYKIYLYVSCNMSYFPPCKDFPLWAEVNLKMKAEIFSSTIFSLGLEYFLERFTDLRIFSLEKNFSLVFFTQKIIGSRLFSDDFDVNTSLLRVRSAGRIKKNTREFFFFFFFFFF